MDLPAPPSSDACDSSAVGGQSSLRAVAARVLILVLGVAVTLLVWSYAAPTVTLHLNGDPSAAQSRFIKVAALQGSRVLFAQTYSCDRKDCYPTREDIAQLKSVYGTAKETEAATVRLRLDRLSAHASSLRWKGKATAGPVTVRAVIYSLQFVPLASAEQTRPFTLGGLWGGQFRVAERGSRIEVALN